MLARARTRALLLAALLGGLLVATGGDVGAEGLPPPPGDAFVEDFSGEQWFHRWGHATQPWNTTTESEGSNRFLRAHIAAGGHDGASFFKPTGTADAATLRYRLRLGPAFDPRRADNDVKLPGFGSPSILARRQCLAGCGGGVLDGILGHSARVHITEDGVPGFYVYDLQPGILSYGRGLPWSSPALEPGRWYTIELRIRMNTPGRMDGVLLASLDGQRVFEQRDLAFRATPLLHVGGAWFDFYYGGRGVAPADTAIDVDDVVLTLTG